MKIARGTYLAPSLLYVRSNSDSASRSRVGSPERQQARVQRAHSPLATTPDHEGANPVGPGIERGDAPRRGVVIVQGQDRRALVVDGHHGSVQRARPADSPRPQMSLLP